MSDCGTEDSVESAEELVARIIGSLRQSVATDTSLLEIITKHVVTLSPVDNAIELAMQDIEVLAKERGEQVD